MKFFRSKFFVICFFVLICFQSSNFYAFSFNLQASKEVSRNIFDKKKFELVIKKICEKKYLILSSVFGAAFIGAVIVFLKNYFSGNPDDPKGPSDPIELDDLKELNDPKELGLSGENSPDIIVAENTVALPIEQKDDNIKVVVEDLKAKDEIINTEIKEFVGNLIDQVNLNVNSENDLANLEVRPDLVNVVSDKESKLEQVENKIEFEKDCSVEKNDIVETEEDGESLKDGGVTVLIKKYVPEEKKIGKDTLELLLMIDEQGEKKVGKEISKVNIAELNKLEDEQIDNVDKTEKEPKELEKNTKEEEILGDFIDNELKKKEESNKECDLEDLSDGEDLQNEGEKEENFKCFINKRFESFNIKKINDLNNLASCYNNLNKRQKNELENILNKPNNEKEKTKFNELIKENLVKRSNNKKKNTLKKEPGKVYEITYDFSGCKVKYNFHNPFDINAFVCNWKKFSEKDKEKFLGIIPSMVKNELDLGEHKDVVNRFIEDLKNGKNINKDRCLKAAESAKKYKIKRIPILHNRKQVQPVSANEQADIKELIEDKDFFEKYQLLKEIRENRNNNKDKYLDRKLEEKEFESFKNKYNLKGDFKYFSELDLKMKKFEIL